MYLEHEPLQTTLCTNCELGRGDYIREPELTRRRLTSKIRLMNDFATTRLSSKGQVVIPEAIRRRLGLQSGTEFVVFGEDGTVVLKVIEAPSMQEFDEIVARAREGARRAGLRKSDIADAIRAVRSA